MDRQVEQFVENEVNNANENEDELDVGSSSGMDMELSTAVEDLTRKTMDNGFPQEHESNLRRIVRRFDIWGLCLGDDPPARVSPMKVRLKENAVPYRCKARKYPPEIRKFLNEFNEELVNLGWVYENASSRRGAQSSLCARTEEDTDKQQIINQLIPLLKRLLA